MNVDAIARRLNSLVEARRQAARKLAVGLGMAPEELFYAYIRGQLPDQRGVVGDLRYYFHGLGCSVKDADGIGVELEFGPHGRYDAFDKYTVCHDLGFHVDQCDSVIGALEKQGVIKLVDPQLLNRAKAKTGLESEVDQIDASVADRYVVVGFERTGDLLGSPG